MNWITVTWTMVASACLTVALIHLGIWFKNRQGHIQLLFAVAALAVAGIAACELHMMLAQTTEQFGLWMRYIQVPICIAVISIAWFVRFYLQAGRVWLVWSVCALRLLALVLNFVFTPNLNYREITSLRRIELLGVTVSVPQGIVSQRTRVGELSSLLLLAFVVDASTALWRRGSRADRHRAVVIGGSVAFFVFVGTGHVTLIHAGVISTPYMISLAFLIPVAAMEYELAFDVLRSTRLARELETSQADLREDEQRLALLATAAELGMWRWDIVRDEIWMSETCRTLFGLSTPEPINLDRFLKVLYPDDHQTFIHSFTNSMNGDGDYECEVRVPLRDGQMRWIVGHGRVEFNGQRKPIIVRGIALDITRRKQAEDRCRLMVETAPNAIVAVNSDGRITLINVHAEEVFGFARLELIGQPIETLIPERFRSDHRDFRRDYLLAPQSRAMGTGRELFGLRKDGSEVPVDVGLNPIQTPEGTLILASVIDTTERTQAERDQARQRNELTHLSRVAMLGELSGALAHELNQPLTAILSNAQAAQEFLAQDSKNLDEVRGILQDIVGEDRRAREVIRRLRMLFRKGEIQFEQLDLNELVLEVLKLMNSELVNHDVTIQTELAPGLPRVNGDRVQLTQVLINLIVNASDAMVDNDNIGRRMCVTTLLAGNGDVGIIVADTGCGIAPEEMGQIFEPFHTTKTIGMGLGLAVCRTIISAHAGKLWATNNPDRGACFHMTFSPTPIGVS